uniref:Collagenase NC10/endostatin domain-containing protein n=1 Tax=Oryzias latipes TaxID=8090 RepID=A0A3B3H4M5_ORYLA
PGNPGLPGPPGRGYDGQPGPPGPRGPPGPSLTSPYESIQSNTSYCFGSMHGLIGVDAMCYKQAQAIKMKGTFRAFLSSRLQDLYSIVHSAQRNAVPIVNLKDEVLFDSWINIFKEGKINENVSIYSFDGKDVLRDDTWPEKMVWHGSSHEGQRNVNNMCESWRVNDQAVTGMAASLLQGSFMQQSPSSCSSSHVVLCIENSVTEY